MSELTLFLIRVASLAVRWIVVLAALSGSRTDMFGARLPASSGARTPRSARKQNKVAKTPRRRGSPTHVVVIEGANSGDRAELGEVPVLIGRGPDAAIRLDDDYVSTRHARIAASGDEWYVEDLGSTNGTYVGANRLTEPLSVTVGSQVRIGKTVLELRK